MADCYFELCNTYILLLTLKFDHSYIKWLYTVYVAMQLDLQKSGKLNFHIIFCEGKSKGQSVFHKVQGCCMENKHSYEVNIIFVVPQHIPEGDDCIQYSLTQT